MVLRLSTFPTDVASVLLTGLSIATNAAIVATDTVLVALGKLQAQLNTKAPLANPPFTGSGSITTSWAIGSNTTQGTATLNGPTNTGKWLGLQNTGVDRWQIALDGATSNSATGIWAASTAYALNAVINNGVNCYKVTTAGTSGTSGGPTGTGTGIADGTVVWSYVGPANQGDNFALWRWDDPRQNRTTPFGVNHATQQVQIASGLSVVGGASTDTLNVSGAVSGAGFTSLVQSQAATVAPLIDGTAAVGTSLLYARQDHVHPTDTSRYAASNPSGYQTAAQVTTTLAAPGPIGSTTANTGTFTTLGASTAATGNHFWAGVYPFTDWLGIWAYGDSGCPMMGLHNSGGAGVSGASRADLGTSSSSAPIGVLGFGFASGTGTKAAYPAWGGYFEARQFPNSTGFAHGVEMDITNLSGTTVAITPYNFFTAGGTNALWLGSGGGISSSFKAYNPATGLDDLSTPVAASTCIGILSNGAQYSRGITFQASALSGTTGVDTDTTTAVAISVARNQQFEFQDQSGREAALFGSSVTSTGAAQKLLFSNSGPVIQNGAGTTLFTFGVSAASVNGITANSNVTGQSPTIYATGSDTNISLTLGSKGAGSLQVQGTVVPTADNTYYMGFSSNRWVAVYAVNGTIQTSDPALKTDIAPLPAALPLIAAINPITFRWKDGGAKPVTKTVTVQKPVMQSETKMTEDYETQPDGSVHRVQRPIATETPIIDLVPVTDPDGTPVVDRVMVGQTKPGGAAIYEDKPRHHPVPRTQAVTETVTEYEHQPGARTHWGFAAPEVKAAFDAIGMDFGGYVLAEDGTHNLRPDQMIPVLWKAVQELAEQVTALRATARPCP
jgi:hypothetical protein